MSMRSYWAVVCMLASPHMHWATSVMYSYKPFMALRTAWAVQQVRFCMAVYGGGSLKPSWLVGTAPWLHRLASRLGQADRAFLMTPSVLTTVQSVGAVVMAALAAVKRLRPNGLLFAAPVCSTWVFMSRGSTGRDLALAGHWKSSRSVMAANAMAARVAALCHFAASAGSHFVVEQPATSVMYSYKPFLALRTAWAVQQVRFCMAVYGGGSLKPSWLVGTAPWLHRLASRLGQADRAFLMTPSVLTTVQSVGPGGKKCSTGSSQLKGTQAYPLQFGAALAAEFKRYMGVVELAVASATPREAQAYFQQYDPPASAAMTAGDIDADHMHEGDEELWCNPDWFLMDIVSGKPDMWRD